MEFARSMGLREGENPARWKGHLARCPAQGHEDKPDKASPGAALRRIAAFMAELRGVPGIAARAFEFTILTAVRTGEARFARGPNSILRAVWTIPGDRMKGDKEHRVPLSDRALAILRELPREGRRGFRRPQQWGVHEPGRDGRRAGEAAAGRDGPRLPIDLPGLGGETTHYPNHLLEMALAHAIPNGVEAAYRRGDLFEKRAGLMSAWAAHCAFHGVHARAMSKDRPYIAGLPIPDRTGTCSGGSRTNVAGESGGAR